MLLKKIPTRQLGKNGPTVSAIGLGAMGMGAFYGNSDDNESLKALTYAADRGVTFWDTADVYGTSEQLIGKWFSETGRRSEIFLATKFGALNNSGFGDPTRQNSKPTHIRQRFQSSLKLLKTDYIDLYYQHRVDPEVPIETVVETLRPFVENGQLRWIGLSEPSIDTVKRAKAVQGVGERVIVVQNEFSPFELSVEKTGFADEITKLGMGLVAYSPLARGLVTGRFQSPADFEKDDFRHLMPRFSKENFPKNLEVAKKFQVFGEKYNATASQVALAWILAEHHNFVPIPGIRTVGRVEENAHAAELELSPEDVKAIREVVESADIAGGRCPDWMISKGDCISLSEWKGEPDRASW